MSQGMVFYVFVMLSPSMEARADNEASDEELDAKITEYYDSAMQDYEDSQAERWELTFEEWERYKSLMDGIRGSVSPKSISPVEVLGIHARSDEERREYAEHWARMYRDDVERVLAFQREFDAAQRRLFPSIPLIDRSRLPTVTVDGTHLRDGDRVLFFTKLQCPPCEQALSRILIKLRSNPTIGMDIYVLSEGRDDHAIRDWAEGLGISADAVRRRQITLNHDNGTLARITGALQELPFALRKRGDKMDVFLEGVEAQ